VWKRNSVHVSDIKNRSPEKVSIAPFLTGWRRPYQKGICFPVRTFGKRDDRASLAGCRNEDQFTKMECKSVELEGSDHSDCFRLRTPITYATCRSHPGIRNC
jgi:hypothetical protein